MIDLRKFCDPEITRYGISLPWRDGNRVCATDTRIAIVCDGSLYDGPSDAEGRKLRLDDVLMPVNWDGYTTPLGDDAIICAECKSKGEITKPCARCGGSGQCCCNCGDEHNCCDCEGSGDKTEICLTCVVMLGNRRVPRKRYNLLKLLPNVFWGVTDDDPTSLIHFKFDGGRGALMPCPQDDE